MAKFHVNDKGDPGPCSAQNGKCPFGGEAQHYATPEIARQAFELSLASEAIPSPVSKDADGAIVPKKDHMSVFIDYNLEMVANGGVSKGTLVTQINGKPELVQHDDDPTAPYPLPVGFQARGGIATPYDSEEAIELYTELISSGRRAIDEKNRSIDAPKFDEFDYDAANSARERVSVLYGRQAAYEKIVAGLKLTATKEEAADYLIASQRKDDPRPNDGGNGVELRTWQARQNTIGEFIQGIYPMGEDRARWCLENMAPVKYKLSQTYSS